ncbi:MAG: hypothetical protein WAS21_29190 [Geminicoccaceae bacterium]
MDMHAQSPVNSIHPAIELRITIRLWLWASLVGFLIGAFGLLMLPLASVSLPFPFVVHLILIFAPLLLLSRGILFITGGAGDRSLLTFAMTAAGIELFCTLITIFWRATFGIVTDQPMPDLDFLFTHRHNLIGGAALCVLLYAFLHGPVLSGSSSDAARRPAVLLHLYVITRLLVAFALGLPLEHPTLAYSTAAALPLGLALGLLTAFLLDRFRPRPESLPPAPGS